MIRETAGDTLDTTGGMPNLVGGATRFLLLRLRGARLVGMALAMCLMLVAAWLTNIPAILLGRAVDRIVAGGGQATSAIGVFLILISVAILGREVLVLVRKLIVEGIATAIERDEFVRVVDYLLSVDLRFMVNPQIGALQKKIDRSIEGVVKLLKLTFLDLLPTAAAAGVAIYMAAQLHSSSLAVMAPVVVCGTFATLLQVRSQKGIRVHLFRAKEGMSAKVVELLFGIEYVRASGAKGGEVASSARLASSLRTVEYRHHKWMMSFDGAKQLIEGAGMVGIIALGASLARAGSISTGDVLSLAVLYMSVAAPLRELHRIIDEGFEATLKIDDLRQLYGLPPDPGLAGTAPVCPLPVCNGGVVVRCRDLRVEMSRENDHAVEVLRGVSIDITHGTIVGIAGPSGSGKSTFAKVLLGLVSHYTGSVEVFGTEVRNLDKEALAQVVSYVPQVPFVIAGTVRHNVTYETGSRDVTDQEIRRALDAAQIPGALVERLGGLDGGIAEMGRNLSGGERQRLVLSRVLLKRAPLIVLDEATAALDNQSELLVQQSIEDLSHGANTTLVIAHRLSTLRSADRVLVFDGGHIVQDGTYETLSAMPGVFRNLVELQKAGIGGHHWDLSEAEDTRTGV
jgi:ATP-binding cassette subfamily B protein